MFFQARDDANFRQSMFNSIVAPRPIGWISTMNAEGVPNLAPFAYFNGISSSPPMVMFACNAPADRPEKDTLANVRATGQFVTNFLSWDFREAMNKTSAMVPAGVDEFELAGLRKLESRMVKPPRVAGVPVAMECELERIVDIPPRYEGDRACGIVVGRVLCLHVADEFIDADGRFDTAAARPLTRLGGFMYATVGETCEIARPKVQVKSGDAASFSASS
jgi:flavin reductase (DIM6/NTAB) family NADH-FMN oxidoreductase RutF